MSSERDDADDLVVLARRGSLSDTEQRRLRETLSASVETQLLYDAGCAFDREAPVLSGDDERIERIARQVQKGSRRSRTTRRWVHVAQGAAAGVLFASAAAGAIELATWSSRSKGIDSSHAAATAATSSAPVVPRPSTPTPADSAGSTNEELTLPKAPEPSLQRSVETSPEPPLPHHAAAIPPLQPSALPALIAPAASMASAPEAPAQAASNALTSTPGSTAIELFSAANSARVHGDMPLAMALYGRLESEFPRSTEAMTAHLSLGVLFLQQGRPGRALDEFRRCRTLGMSTPEVLWGEAQSLQQLGHAEEERTVLEELLQKYPTSAYAAAARKRLTASN
jgi:TolA-binding protein